MQWWIRPGPRRAWASANPAPSSPRMLVAGTRAQLIIKLFGEDLDVLKDKSGEIAAVLGGIRGATDINVEKVAAVMVTMAYVVGAGTDQALKVIRR